MPRPSVQLHKQRAKRTKKRLNSQGGRFWVVYVLRSVGFRTWRFWKVFEASAKANENGRPCSGSKPWTNGEKVKDCDVEVSKATGTYVEVSKITDTNGVPRKFGGKGAKRFGLLQHGCHAPSVNTDDDDTTDEDETQLPEQDIVKEMDLGKRTSQVLLWLVEFATTLQRHKLELSAALQNACALFCFLETMGMKCGEGQTQTDNRINLYISIYGHTCAQGRA